MVEWYVNSELRRMWEVAIVARFKALLRHLLGRSEKEQE
jgi:hypothetical protein